MTGTATERTVRLHHLDRLPDGFLDTPAAELHRLLPGPSLVHIPGERSAPLFVAVLQHGNEETGLAAVQRLLKDYGTRRLPRALSLFIGNVDAARHGRRRLDGQADYNRAWPGSELSDGPERHLLAEVLETMRARRPFASVDIHNTTGENPHYACVNQLDARSLQLARVFGRTVVYFTRPRGLQAQAFLAMCPAVMLECGRSGRPAGVAHARDYLERCLLLEALPERPPAVDDIDLFRSVAMVRVPDSVRFDVGPPGAGDDDSLDLHLVPEIDRFNFRELPAGTVFGQCRAGRWPIRATAPAGQDVTAEFFECRGRELRLRRSVMPTLLTRDPRIVRQDCLCHLLQRARPPASAHARTAVTGAPGRE